MLKVDRFARKTISCIAGVVVEMLRLKIMNKAQNTLPAEFCLHFTLPPEPGCNFPLLANERRLAADEGFPPSSLMHTCKTGVQDDWLLLAGSGSFMSHS